MAARKYEDLSGTGRALDIVGERWALLVVRELLLGPKRFGDLRSGLRHVSQNVLSQRLRQLEADGVLRRVRLGPPLSTQAYELTEAGRALEPVLVALSRWGATMPAPEEGSMSPGAYALMLKDLYRPTRDAPPIRVRLLVDGDALDVDADADAVAVRRAPTHTQESDDLGDRDAVISGTVDALRAVMFEGASFDDATAAGELAVIGDRSAASRFLASFALPQGQQAAASATA